MTRKDKTMSEKLIITPRSKVGELFEAYPQLEELLIAQATIFQKLKNPILRKTVAKAATLEQAASMAGIPVEDLVSSLREAIGQQTEPISASGTKSSQASRIPPEAPAWLKTERIVETLDADEFLQKGVHPLNNVTALVKSSAEGDIIKLNSSFIPTPLLETVEKMGGSTFTAKEGENTYSNYILVGRKDKR